VKGTTDKDIKPAWAHPVKLYQGCQTNSMRVPSATRKDDLGWRCLVLSQIFISFAPLASLCWKDMCIYKRVDCVEIAYELPLLQNNIASETFLHKSGAMQSVDRGPGLTMTGRVRNIERNVLQSSF
jgi:hypothetical protein